MIPFVLLAQMAAAVPPAPLRFGHFGEVAVYRPAVQATATALFFSGDGGWNQGVQDMARNLAQSGTLVLGIDTPRFLRALDASGASCAYLAGEAEALSQFGQKALGLPAYGPPMLVGYSSGAALVYATLAQAPDNTFLGGVSIGFDPALPMRTALCERNGLTTTYVPKHRRRIVQPVAHLPAPWIVLQGTIDHDWPVDSAATFAAAVPGTDFVRLPHVGHGFSEQANWMPQFKEAVARLAPHDPESAAPPGLGGLPVIELPDPGDTATDYFAVVLSGDGGWASLDKQIAQELVRAGVPVVGFNSLQYFWNRRTPDESAGDLERVIRHYQQVFHRQAVVLVGYSRGADVLPLMVSRLPAGLIADIRLVALLGLEHQTSLEFRVGDWLGAQPDAAYPLLPEVKKLQGTRLLCVYGSREKDTLCPALPAGLAEVVRLDGGHHFDGDYRGLAQMVLAHAR
ncbi:MAG TPA: AcvB/VirJ family lysyl-phosphatidylglycerol hydrolase [Gemmatimonadales bacterium]|nr:AcvB/VirJ family lysyl-phosphatidylglycerol hydrolase [Gemmatimonadales bacterium]